MIRNAKKLALSAIFIPILTLNPVFGLLKSDDSEKIEPKPHAEQITKVPINKALEKWIWELGKCESGNREGIKVLDVNGEFSYGLLQFQEKTFISYAKDYKLFPNTEDQELFNLLYDGYSQKLLAKEMIKRDYSNWKHWRNCVEKIGLPPSNG